MLDLSALDVAEIATALQDQTDYEHRWLINPRTGEIGVLDDGRWHRRKHARRP